MLYSFVCRDGGTLACALPSQEELQWEISSLYTDLPEGPWLQSCLILSQLWGHTKLQLQATTDAEKTAGVWTDGQYLGYVKELKGNKKILLLPGEHKILIRQAGYLDFRRKVVLQAGEKQLLTVALQKDTRVQLPTVTAEIMRRYSTAIVTFIVDIPAPQNIRKNTRMLGSIFSLLNSSSSAFRVLGPAKPFKN